MRSRDLVLRPVQSQQDCKEIVTLVSSCFPHEVRATRMSTEKWREIKSIELLREPRLWKQCGLACQDQRIVGAIILAVENEPESRLSYWEVSRRAGCIPSCLKYCYDRVLDESLEPNECLIDILAVIPEARGKGVAKALLEWAEKTARVLLHEQIPSQLDGSEVRLTLWVAAGNVPAYRLYSKMGYTLEYKTSEGPCAFISSAVFQRFLGYSTWLKMGKIIHPPNSGIDRKTDGGISEVLMF